MIIRHNSPASAFSFKFYIAIFFFLIHYSAMCQPGIAVLEKLADKFQSLTKNSPSELVYLQTNKGIYENGEDLWFKAFLLDSHYFIPSTQSQTLYLQLINDKTGQAVWNEKYEVKNGFADGHVFLQDSLSEGDYLMAAYTQNSYFNDSAEFHAIRKIKVKKDMKPRIMISPEFNRQFYSEGDTIRLKLTILSAQRKPLYAEVKGELKQGNKTLANAQATGDKGLLAIALKCNGEGLRVNLKVKYTNREDAFSFAVPHTKGNPYQFNSFPEGGNFVAGIPANLAFKAVNIDGNPIDVVGKLFEDDRPLLEFKSVHCGMGSLAFTPLEGKHYHIRLNQPAIDSTFVLPEVYAQGIAMQLTGRDAQNIWFTISQSPGRKKAPVYLRGQLRGIVFCMASGFLVNELKIKMPLKEFGTQGIAEFTLFDENLMPIAERLVYVNPEKKLHIEALTDKEKYEVREKIVLKIKVTDQDGQPVVANLGVSVYDQLYQNPDDQKTILTHCYLSSQLKGKIYDPGWYFDEKNNYREQALDLLMLTQGWRRYVWNEEYLQSCLKTRLPVVFDGIPGDFRLTKKLKNAPKGEQMIMAFNPGKSSDINFVTTDSTGRFMVTPNNLKTWQGGYVYLKPISSTDFEPRISLYDPIQAINETRKNKEMNYPLPKQSEKIEQQITPVYVTAGVIKLTEVVVTGHGIPTFRDKYMGHLNSIAKFGMCSDYVCWKCGGFNENNPPGKRTGLVLNCKFHDTDRSHKPEEGIEYVIRFGENLATGVFKGANYIIYHYPKLTEEELLRMNNLYRIKAYYAQREFYQAKYDKESESDVTPDTRNTLLWVPAVNTNEKGEATLEFFCSDINNGFVGKIEGVSSEGLLGGSDFGFKTMKTKPFKWEK